MDDFMLGWEFSDEGAVGGEEGCGVGLERGVRAIRSPEVGGVVSGEEALLDVY